LSPLGIGSLPDVNRNRQPSIIEVGASPGGPLLMEIRLENFPGTISAATVFSRCAE
jgi:hypothetical protein